MASVRSGVISAAIIAASAAAHAGSFSYAALVLPNGRGSTYVRGIIKNEAVGYGYTTSSGARSALVEAPTVL